MNGSNIKGELQATNKQVKKVQEYREEVHPYTVWGWDNRFNEDTYSIKHMLSIY